VHLLVELKLAHVQLPFVRGSRKGSRGVRARVREGFVQGLLVELKLAHEQLPQPPDQKAQKTRTSRLRNKSVQQLAVLQRYKRAHVKKTWDALVAG
jgi:hypothetical protein